MNYYLQSIEYILSRKDKGYPDEAFNTEYDYICYEVYKIKHPESIQEVNSIQTKTLLQREKLR